MRVLDAGVEPLAAGRAVDVGGVAGDQQAAGAERAGELARDAERARPVHPGDGEAAGPALVEHPLEVGGTRRVGRRITVDVAGHAPQSARHRRGHRHAVAAEEVVDRCTVERRVDLDVAKLKDLVVRRAGVELDVRGGTHGRAQPVAADRIARADPLEPVGAEDRGHDAVGALHDAHELHPPLDLPPQRLQAPAQDALELVLGQDRRLKRRAGHPVGAHGRELTLADEVARALQVNARAAHAGGDRELVEHFEAA